MLSEKEGPVNKDSVEGYLALEIMCTGLMLVSLFDELHPYPIVFSNAVEWLVRRPVVHEKALAFVRKDRGGFYEKKIPNMGLAGAASGKSLKQLA